MKCSWRAISHCKCVNKDPLPDALLFFILQDIIEKGLLSGLQLESITYACQRHEQLLPNNTRSAFFIGDGKYVV